MRKSEYACWGEAEMQENVGMVEVTTFLHAMSVLDEDLFV